MTSDHPITRSPDHPIPRISPLDAWIAIKTVLARELGEREEETWIRHLRLMRVMTPESHRPTLLIAVPRRGRVTFGALRFYGDRRKPGRIRKLAYKAGFHVALAIAPDPDAIRLAREYAATLDDRDKRKWQLLDKYHEDNYTFLEAECSELWRNV